MEDFLCVDDMVGWDRARRGHVWRARIFQMCRWTKRLSCVSCFLYVSFLVGGTEDGHDFLDVRDGAAFSRHDTFTGAPSGIHWHY